MAILNEKFGFVVRDASTGLPTSGQLVELREGSNNYVLTEKATSGFYEVASIPTGKYSAYVNSVDSGSTFGVGTGQVAALGNTLDNVAVSTASEFGFQAPSVFKATLDLDLVTNKAIPLAVAADENKIISVNAAGDYVLSSPSSTGFAAVFEANSASELEAALSAPIAQKTIINTKPLEGYNYFSSKSISVYGVNSIYGANIDWSCQTGIVVNFVNDATDPNTPKIKFFTSVTSFGNNSKYVGAIEPLLEIRNLSILDAEINDTTGNSLVYEKLLFSNVTGTKNITQNFWDNTSGAAGGQVDSVVGGTNCTVDATDPINPIVNAADAPIQSLANVGSGEDVFKQTTGAGIAQFKTLTGGTNVTLDVSSGNDITINAIGGSASPLTTKGDLYTYDTADARLPIGADGQALVVDTAEATGLKYVNLSETPAVGGGLLVDLGMASTDQAITVAAGATTINFDDTLTGAIDKNGDWDNANKKFVVTSASGTGTYQFEVNIFAQNNTAGYYNLQAFINGSLKTLNGAFAMSDAVDDSGYDGVAGTISIDLDVGDEVEIKLQSYQATTTIRANGTWNFTQGMRISKTSGIKGDKGDTGATGSGGDVYLANTQTFTGVNTFSNNINASQLINHADYPTGSTAIGNVWRDGNNLKFRDAFYTKNLTYNASSSLSQATLTVDTSIYSQFALRSQAVNLTIAAPINGLNDGQKLTLRIKDNGVSKNIIWNAVFVAIGTTLPLATVAGKYLYVGCIYDESAAKWHVVAVSQEA